MSNNKQQVELTDITAPLLAATQGLTMEDRSIVHLLLDCAERGERRGKKPPPSICKVSRILRNLSESSFIPQLVSIGPIHRRSGKLREFERQKECYLNDLLHRCDSTPKKTLEECLQKVKTKIPKIKESYGGMIKNYSDVELVRMMVMDGCFILEFCFKHEDGNLPNKMQAIRIAMDLMLLENQLPFFVLQDLFDCSMGKASFTLTKVLDKYLAPYIMLFRVLPEKNSIPRRVLKLLCSLLPEKTPTTDVDSDSTDHDHVLGYLHKRYWLVATNSSKSKHAEASKLVDAEQAAKSSNPIHADAETSKLVDAEEAAKSSNLVDDEVLRGHTIVELDRSGMKFKPHQEDEWSMTIKFQSSLFPCLPWFGSKSTLLMPTLLIDDFTEPILWNFIAYEQLLQDRYYFTSYAHAMDKLIDTQEDIAKLVESKVLLNILGSNEDAADMINKICKSMFVTDFYYARDFKQMDKYYNLFWPMIKRTYFSNPWNAINLLFGIIAFVATVVSAIFAILDYFR